MAATALINSLKSKTELERLIPLRDWIIKNLAIQRARDPKSVATRLLEQQLAKLEWQISNARSTYTTNLKNIPVQQTQEYQNEQTKLKANNPAVTSTSKRNDVLDTMSPASALTVENPVVDELNPIYDNKKKATEEAINHVRKTFWDAINWLRENLERTKWWIAAARAWEQATALYNAQKNWISAAASQEAINDAFINSTNAINQFQNQSDDKINQLMEIQNNKELQLHQLNSTDTDNYLRAKALDVNADIDRDFQADQARDLAYFNKYWVFPDWSWNSPDWKRLDQNWKEIWSWSTPSWSWWSTPKSSWAWSWYKPTWNSYTAPKLNTTNKAVQNAYQNWQASKSSSAQVNWQPIKNVMDKTTYNTKKIELKESTPYNPLVWWWTILSYPSIKSDNKKLLDWLNKKSKTWVDWFDTTNSLLPKNKLVFPNINNPSKPKSSQEKYWYRNWVY